MLESGGQITVTSTSILFPYVNICQILTCRRPDGVRNILAMIKCGAEVI